MGLQISSGLIYSTCLLWAIEASCFDRNQLNFTHHMLKPELNVLLLVAHIKDYKLGWQRGVNNPIRMLQFTARCAIKPDFPAILPRPRTSRHMIIDNVV